MKSQRIMYSKKPEDLVYLQKIRELMDRFGFRNKEVIIEEEDPAAI